VTCITGRFSGFRRLDRHLLSESLGKTRSQAHQSASRNQLPLWKWNRSTVRRGRLPSRSSFGVSEQATKFGRSPFEDPLLSPRRASPYGYDAFGTLESVQLSKGFTPAGKRWRPGAWAAMGLG